MAAAAAAAAMATATASDRGRMFPSDFQNLEAGRTKCTSAERVPGPHAVRSVRGDAVLGSLELRCVSERVRRSPGAQPRRWAVRRAAHLLARTRARPTVRRRRATAAPSAGPGSKNDCRSYETPCCYAELVKLNIILFYACVRLRVFVGRFKIVKQKWTLFLIIVLLATCFWCKLIKINHFLNHCKYLFRKNLHIIKYVIWYVFWRHNLTIIKATCLVTSKIKYLILHEGIYQSKIVCTKNKFKFFINFDFHTF